MTSSQTGGSVNTHQHNPELEGMLPIGFEPLGRQGKVRNIYESTDGQSICLIASDRVSAFDQVSPTPIPGKGELLNKIAAQELCAAEAAQISTWFDIIYSENPRASIGTKAEVQPVEMIFRNYMTGSMWREYKETGDFTGLGLPKGLSEWADFTSEPLFTPSTKSDKDVNFNAGNVEEVTGIDAETFDRMHRICRKLFELGTARANSKGLILVDTKYEIGKNSNGDYIIIDEVHTPDSSRFVLKDDFKELIEAGEKPISLSKEFLRGVMLGRAGGDVDIAKQLMAEPLAQSVVDEVAEKYNNLYQIFKD